MVLGLTQPLTEISIRNISWGGCKSESATKVQRRQRVDYGFKYKRNLTSHIKLIHHRVQHRTSAICYGRSYPIRELT